MSRRARIVNPGASLMAGLRDFPPQPQRVRVRGPGHDGAGRALYVVVVKAPTSPPVEGPKATTQAANPRRVHALARVVGCS